MDAHVPSSEGKELESKGSRRKQMWSSEDGNKASDVAMGTAVSGEQGHEHRVNEVIVSDVQVDQHP